MANRRLSVRKATEIQYLELDCGISEREIARRCQVSRSTFADYLRRAAAAKLIWEEAPAMAEAWNQRGNFDCNGLDILLVRYQQMKIWHLVQVNYSFRVKRESSEILVLPMTGLPM